MFVTRPLVGPALDRLAAAHEVELHPGADPPSPEELRAGASPCEALLCTLVDRIDAALLDACPRLRVIANYAVGYDNIDVAAARARGIAVGNTPDVLTAATADFAFGLLLAAARRIVDGERAVRAGESGPWRADYLLGPDVSGTTLGIVGYGKIGRAVAQRARGFDMEVLWSSSSDGVPLAELLERSDHVSLHCPLTEETFHLIDEAALRAMKPTAVLVNTARGPVVDPVALRRALDEGWIAAAALDVTESEPLPPGDPLFDAPRLVLTPHIASASVGARSGMAEVAVDNVLAGLAGQPLPHAVA